MLTSKPLLQRDIFETLSSLRRPVMESGRQAGEAAKGTVASADTIQATLAKAYERIQSSVQSRFPNVGEAANIANSRVAANDFSPQAVADRIVGFVANHLAREKAAGASEERLQSLYQQALKGVEKGLREGRDIIMAHGLFSGDTKDTFYQTVNRIADGLQQLGESMFNMNLDKAQNTASTAVEARRTQVQVERSRSFEMEVVTQEGDRVKIQVNSGQSFASDHATFSNRNGNGVSQRAEALDARFSSYDNLSFSVEGDLNEQEMAALNDLFGQVNRVADTFYGGDVEAAFNQAMDVGMNPEQLASFAVNMNQAETVAVRDVYVSVQNMAGLDRANPYQDMHRQLGEFAREARAGADKLQAHEQSIANLRSLYAELLGRMHSDNSEGRPRGHGDAFQRFANHLVG